MPPKEHPWSPTTATSGARSCSTTTDHVVGMEPDEGRALLDDLLARSTAPGGSTATPGRSATS